MEQQRRVQVAEQVEAMAQIEAANRRRRLEEEKEEERRTAEQQRRVAEQVEAVAQLEREAAEMDAAEAEAAAMEAEQQGGGGESKEGPPAIGGSSGEIAVRLVTLSVWCVWRRRGAVCSFRVATCACAGRALI